MLSISLTIVENQTQTTFIFIKNFQIFLQNCQNIREQSFFVKSLPINNIGKRSMLEETGIFKKESRIFKDLIPKLLKYSGNYLFCLSFCLDDKFKREIVER